VQTFYLHIHNGHGDAEADEPIQVMTLAAAKEHAISGIRELLAAEVVNGVMDMGGYIEIADAGGNPVLRVPFVEALQIKSEP
jgi:hypothetical protein